MTNTDTIHAAKAPLQSPARQAADLIQMAKDHGQDIAYVREHIAAEVREGDSRLWAVAGHNRPMTGTAYHALVLAEIDRAIGDRLGSHTVVNAHRTVDGHDVERVELTFHRMRSTMFLHLRGEGGKLHMFTLDLDDWDRVTAEQPADKYAHEDGTA